MEIPDTRVSLREILRERWPRPRTFRDWARITPGILFLVVVLPAASAYVLSLTREEPTATFPPFISVFLATVLVRNLLVTHPFWRRPSWVKREQEVFLQGTCIMFLVVGAFLAFGAAEAARYFSHPVVFVAGTATVYIALLFLGLSFGGMQMAYKEKPIVATST